MPQRTKKAAEIALRRLILFLAYRPFGLLEAVVFQADQAPSEAGSTLKPGPMVEDRLIFFT
jgi:hypothetical protein